jgi:predicted helicase
MFATLLDDAKIPARRRLFMTATERIFSARVLYAAKDDGFDLASMDDESQFGPTFHHYTLGRAIAEGRLADYEIAIIGVDPGQDTYRDWAERGRIVRLSPDSAKTTDARTLAGQIGLLKAMRASDLRRGLTFHARVRRAGQFAAEMPEVNAWLPDDERLGAQLWAACVSSGDSEVVSAPTVHRRLPPPM